MLHDPSHYEPPPIAEAIQLSSRDIEVLRDWLPSWRRSLRCQSIKRKRGSGNN